MTKNDKKFRKNEKNEKHKRKMKKNDNVGKNEKNVGVDSLHMVPFIYFSPRK